MKLKVCYTCDFCGKEFEMPLEAEMHEATEHWGLTEEEYIQWKALYAACVQQLVPTALERDKNAAIEELRAFMEEHKLSGLPSHWAQDPYAFHFIEDKMQVST